MHICHRNIGECLCWLVGRQVIRNKTNWKRFFLVVGLSLKQDSTVEWYG